MTTELIPTTVLQSGYSTQLPEKYLHSDNWYMTLEAYNILWSFEDDDRIIDATNSNLLSDGACEAIDLEIDRLFKLWGCPDVFNSQALETLRSYIFQHLKFIDLDEAIIK